MFFPGSPLVGGGRRGGGVGKPGQQKFYRRYLRGGAGEPRETAGDNLPRLPRDCSKLARTAWAAGFLRWIDRKLFVLTLSLGLAQTGPGAAYFSRSKTGGGGGTPPRLVRTKFLLATTPGSCPDGPPGAPTSRRPNPGGAAESGHPDRTLLQLGPDPFWPGAAKIPQAGPRGTGAPPGG